MSFVLELTVYTHQPQEDFTVEDFTVKRKFKLMYLVCWLYFIRVFTFDKIC